MRDWLEGRVIGYEVKDKETCIPISLKITGYSLIKFRSIPGLSCLIHASNTWFLFESNRYSSGYNFSPSGAIKCFSK